MEVSTHHYDLGGANGEPEGPWLGMSLHVLHTLNTILICEYTRCHTKYIGIPQRLARLLEASYVLTHLTEPVAELSSRKLRALN